MYVLPSDKSISRGKSLPHRFTGTIVKHKKKRLFSSQEKSNYCLIKFIMFYGTINNLAVKWNDLYTGGGINKNPHAFNY